MKKTYLAIFSLCTIPSHLCAIDTDLWRGIKLITAYFNNLAHRQNRPTSKEEWIQRVEMQVPELITELKNTVNNDYDYSEHEPRIQEAIHTIRGRWKQNWWDHNPVLGDLTIACGVLAVVALLVMVTRSSDGNPGGRAAFPPLAFANGSQGVRLGDGNNVGEA